MNPVFGYLPLPIFQRKIHTQKTKQSKNGPLYLYLSIFTEKPRERSCELPISWQLWVHWAMAVLAVTRNAQWGPGQLSTGGATTISSQWGCSVGGPLPVALVGPAQRPGPAVLSPVLTWCCWHKAVSCSACGLSCFKFSETCIFF